MCGGNPEPQSTEFEFETCLYQHEGECHVQVGDSDQWTTLKAGECAVVPANVRYTVKREPKSIGWQITQDPTGNNPKNRQRLEKERAEAAASATTIDDSKSQDVAEKEAKKQKTTEE